MYAIGRAKVPTRMASANASGETSAPPLEVPVAQPREPRVAGRQLSALLQEAEGDDEGRKWMRDRRVAPVEHTHAAVVHVQVRVVEVVVLDRLRHVVGSELVAQLSEAGCKVPQSVYLVPLKRQIET